MKVIIFHGWGSTNQDNWFPWLKMELKKKGIDAHVPDLPDSDFPDQNKWLKEALKFDYDNNTILVGHSAGAVLIMHLLKKVKVKSAYLVSGFDNNLGIEDINALFKEPFDFDIIKKHADKIIMIHSDNDSYISMDVAKGLQKKLDCGMIVFEGMDHLSNGTGNLQFPELLEMILNESN